MAITTPTSRSYNMLLRNFYSENRKAAKNSTRESISNNDLIKADSGAVSKVSDTLRKMEYSEDTGSDIYSNVKSFIDTYNNLLTTTDKSDEYTVKHPRKLLQKLTKDDKEALSDIGINISSSGKLEMDEKKFLESSPSKIGAIFSEDSTFTQKVTFYAGKIYKASRHINTKV